MLPTMESLEMNDITRFGFNFRNNDFKKELL